jgi:hypothetical protein
MSIEKMQEHTANRSSFVPAPPTRALSLARKLVWNLAELCLIVLWAVFFARAFLDFSPTAVPAGNEYLGAIQNLTFWTRLRECGACAFWFASVRGGYPALVDPIASILHPIPIVTTLIWGVLNGSKVALVASFALAGIAQWWIAKTLGLGVIARLWTAAIAVVAGNISGRMHLGSYGMVLSNATCGLVLPPLITFTQRASRKSAVLLSVTIALVLVAGAAYVQCALVWTMIPALVAILWQRTDWRLVARRLLMVVGLTFLLVAPVLIPVVHFLPEFSKDHDPTFRGAQPFTYIPLNLVIGDRSFFQSEALDKLPFPSHYFNYIGWIPVLLAIWGVGALLSAHSRRLLAVLLVFAIFPLWLASATPFKSLIQVLPIERLADLISGLRYTAFMAGLAIPAILGLAGIGLQAILNTKWPKFRAELSGGDANLSGLSVDLRWILVVPLLFALNDARSASAQWIEMRPLNGEVPQVVDALRSESLQWVQTVYGEHIWIQPALDKGLFLSRDDYNTWQWSNRPDPEPALVASRDSAQSNLPNEKTVAGITIHRSGAPDFARVSHPDGSGVACPAHGVGGNIDVVCNNPDPGTLIVEENSWSGWSAQMDEGATLSIGSGRWLSVDIPGGVHTIHFRYRPWDVGAGGALFVLGAIVAAFYWRKAEDDQAEMDPP